MADFIDAQDDYNKLSEEELDEKIQDILKKVDMAYSMGQGPVVDQLLFHLDNLKMALGDKLEKQRYEMIQGKLPEQFSITDDDFDEETKK
jgi:hypothetical protein|tara:strand:- start:2810 stop:3079 length:270 start_codon:yes stop_codon:yes gene_type:complete